MVVTLRFPRSVRLVRSEDFAVLRRGGKSLAGHYFHVQYRINSEFCFARLGIAVARRVSKKAVIRNCIKRQLRESFRQQQASLPNIDVLVIARPSAAEQVPSALQADLINIWHRLAALKRDASPGTMRAGP